VDVRDLGGGVWRVSIFWTANAIPTHNWLQVTVKAHEHTGLAEDDVFYFGSAIGDASLDGRTLYNDIFAIYGDVDFSSSVPITDPSDINRDGRVLYNDIFACYSEIDFSARLEMITGPSPAGAAAASPAAGQETSGADTVPSTYALILIPESSSFSGNGGLGEVNVLPSARWPTTALSEMGPTDRTLAALWDVEYSRLSPSTEGLRTASRNAVHLGLQLPRSGSPDLPAPRARNQDATLRRTYTASSQLDPWAVDRIDLLEAASEESDPTTTPTDVELDSDPLTAWPRRLAARRIRAESAVDEVLASRESGGDLR
jgi:hypothetical protein